MTDLFDPVNFGELRLKNRIVMAPMTRSRANAQGVINASAAQYYADRADVGLIVTEGVNIGPMSNSFDRAPGLWTEEQVEGWRPIVDRVHARGGTIVAQLWHGGRASAMGLLDGRAPFSPSGINDDLEKLQVWALLANGAYVKIAATPSRAMTLGEIKSTLDEFHAAAANAVRAGFDGVEIHGANGYLVHEFLSPNTNRRTDDYGGDAAGRSRFLKEIVSVMAEALPLSRIGLRLSPFASYNDVNDDNPADTYGYLSKLLEGLGIAYLHLADTNAWGGASDYDEMIALFRPSYRGSLIVNGGIDPQRAKAIIASGEAEAVAFGRLLLANPDLPARIRQNGPYNQVRHLGVYGGSDEGYLDYPTMDEFGAE